MERSRRKRAYFGLMGGCVLLIVLAWNVVRFWSITAAVVMSVVAAVIPPVAAIVGNLGSLDETADDRDGSWVRSRARDPRRPPGPDG